MTRVELEPLPFTSQAITLNQYTKQASDEVATKSTNKPYPVVKTSCKEYVLNYVLVWMEP